MTRARHMISTWLVVVPLGAALVPLVVPPWTYALLAARIALAALGPAIALAAPLLAALAMVVTRGRRRWLVAVAFGTALLAVMPALAARRPAERAATALGATARGGAARGSAALPNAVTGPLTGPPAPTGLVERAVRYSAADGSPLTGRLFRVPARCAAACPAVVVIYGGAWQRGVATQFAATNRWIAGLGYTVVALDYRHAPAARHPAQWLDVRGGLALLADSSAAWGIDTTRVVLWGRSSGGHLATLAAWHPSDGASGVRVRGVISFYSPYDLVRGYTDLPRPDPIDARAALRALTGGAPDAVPAVYRDASPSSFVRAGLPPTLLVYAGGDHVVKPEFGRDAAAALRRAGNDVVHVELPFAEHGFDFAEGGAAAQAALRLVVAFLESVMR